MGKVSTPRFRFLIEMLHSQNYRKSSLTHDVSPSHAVLENSFGMSSFETDVMSFKNSPRNKTIWKQVHNQIEPQKLRTEL